ncbi:kynureninase [Streptomyces griseus]|uniref:kynureninase n=1 Tax=Streptomyces griseus TaxID=1911 RepID=UPI0036F50AB1
MTTRERALHADRNDSLAGFRDWFVLDPSLTYLDGNSLGALPQQTEERIADVVHREWADRLIRSWNEGWTELPGRAGDLIGTHFLGAGPGQVALSDSTTVNFYKLVSAALDARADRTAIVIDPLNFPTDRYVVDGLAQSRGLHLRPVASDPVLGVTPEAVAAVVDSDTALVTLSHVDYRSGAIADLREITRIAHDAGALVVWDLSHSVGSVPVDLDAAGVDLAVGCTYKYLNGGPGAPAFLYVRRELQDLLAQPIWGWYSQRDQFAMGPDYQPAQGIGRFLTGTPSVLAASAVETSVAVLAEAGIERIRAKSTALTSYFIELADAYLADHGFALASPREADARGGHVTLTHPDAYRICRVLIEQESTVPDFRTPDGLRVGLSPLTTRFIDVWNAVDAVRRVAAAGRHLEIDPRRLAVT